MRQKLWRAGALLVSIFCSALSWGAADEGGEPLNADMRLPLALLVANVEQEFNTLAQMLELVADTPQARSGQWEQIKPLLKQIQAKRQAGAFWFAQPDGTYFTTEKNRMNQKLNDRPYFPIVMNGKVSIGDLVVGRSTQHNVAVVAVPIKADDKVLGMLGVSVELGALSDKLKDTLHLPQNMVFYAVDRQGIVALHSHDERIFLETLTLGGSVTEALRKMVASEQGRLRYEFDKTQRDVVYQASPLIGWRFALGTFQPSKVSQAAR